MLGEVLVRTKGTKITAGRMKELHKDNALLKIFAGGKTFAMVDLDDIPKENINNQPSIIVKSRGIIEFEYYDKPFSHKNEMWSYYSDNKNIDIKFVYYILKQNEPYFQNIGSKMQMPQIATPDTDKFKIPIPPLDMQERIVEILDKFDTLTTSISEGLPREIALRQKQYEYYREKLLAFPHP
ncbi:restriction endonuclease subunit S [Chelonobacter oris]|uniref:restriction endonuclease subunit S n=1 Tax=Chelonobacter oris TaxID=505317 RepID=UPI00244B7108|nr:restriction endonuclease subunit S [Chelonobacter oris]